MAGVDSAGIGEVIQNLIPSFIESMSSRGVLDYPKDRRDVIQVSSFSYVAVEDGLICMLNIEHILDGRTFPLAWPHSTSAIANPISPPAWFTASYCPRG